MEIIGSLIVRILIGKADTIWKYFFSKTDSSEKIISYSNKKPVLDAEIVDKQPYYRRGQDSIKFRSRFNGKIKNGYFVNEIIVQDKSVDKLGYRFDLTTNVNKDGTALKLYCHETINNTSSSIGNLNGNISTEWKYWQWEIPHNAPVLKYDIKMMVFNEGKNESPIQTIEDEIEIIMPEERNNPFDRPPRFE